MGGLIGNYQIPYTPLSEAISIVTTVVNRYGGQIARQSLAKELGLVANGGGFINKLSSIKAYNLLEGTGTLTATDLAQSIVLSKDSKIVAKSKAKAFLQFNLYQKLYERIGTKVPDDDALANILVEITKTSRIEVNKKLGEIKKYYLDAVQYLKALEDYPGESRDQHAEIANQPQTKSMESAQVSPRNEVFAVPIGFDEIKMGEVRIILRPDIEDVAVAKGLIELYEMKIHAQMKKLGVPVTSSQRRRRREEEENPSESPQEDAKQQQSHDSIVV